MKTLRNGRTFGPSDKPLEIASGRIAKPDPKAVQIRHRRIDSCTAVYLIRGQGMYRDSERRLSVKAGDLILRLPGVDHETRPDADGQWLEYFIMLPRPYWDGLVRAGLPGNQPVWQVGVQESLLGIWQQIHDCLSKHDVNAIPDAILLAQKFLVQAWHASREQVEAPVDAKLQRAREALAADITGEISLPELAMELGFGYEHFRKCFKDAYDIAPGQYRQRARMQQAQNLLSTTDLMVQGIALQLGYKDPFSFSKEFKRHSGLAPQRYRRLAR